MDWRHYEKAIVELFVREYRPPQFRVEPQGDRSHCITGVHSGIARQVDAAVYRHGEAAPFLVADAKHWDKKLDVPAIESFIGFVDDVGARVGVLVASKGFSGASPRRATGGTRPIELRVVTPAEAEQLDLLRVGREVFPWDWAFHQHLGLALRVISEGGHPDEIADVLHSTPFEEWTAFVGHAVARHPTEAQEFLTWVAECHTDDGWRFNAIQTLDTHGWLGRQLQRALLSRESDREVRELLESL